jgi:hypothetical protein
MMLDPGTIAAIITGILAVLGGLATAWMSGLNERLVLGNKNKKLIAIYATPLLHSALNLSDWFFDILHEHNYNPKRNKAYGAGWSKQYTSYLMGQYFVWVHLIRSKTQYFSFMKDDRVSELKTLLYTIHNEFISMEYEERENWELRWREGDVLAVQERMRVSADLDGDGKAEETSPMTWVQFQEHYEDVKSGAEAKSNTSEGENDSWQKRKLKSLKDIFYGYEEDFERIVYRRYKHLYCIHAEDGHRNPLAYSRRQEISILSETTDLGYMKLKEMGDDAIRERVKEVYEENPETVVIPDQRVRRLQHLLVDLVGLLDKMGNVERVKFEGKYKKCDPATERCRCKDCLQNGTKEVAKASEDTKHGIGKSNTWPKISRSKRKDESATSQV